MRVQQCWFAHLRCDPLDDAVLRITKALTRRVWQDRDDDTFAEQEPGLSALHQRCTDKAAPKVHRRHFGGPRCWANPSTRRQSNPSELASRSSPNQMAATVPDSVGWRTFGATGLQSARQHHCGPSRARRPLSAGQVPVSSVRIRPAGTGPTRWALRADAKDTIAGWHAGGHTDTAGTDGPAGGAAPEARQPTLCPCQASPQFATWEHLRRTTRYESWWSRQERRHRDGARTSQPTQPLYRWTVWRPTCVASLPTTRPPVAACHGQRR
jgi:hypothetical protein